MIPEFLNLDEQVEIWLNKIGIETIKSEAKKIKTVNWETLKNKR